MPLPTPFHPRTSALCTSYRWKEWAGYYAVCSFDTTHDSEYHAFRQSCGMIDVSPLYKYEVTGKDAARFLSHVMARDIQKLKLGQVTYVCWCDDEGKTIDDGTVARIEETHYRVTAALPNFSWFSRLTPGFDVKIEDSSTRFGALSLQGPLSRHVLKSATDAALMDGIKFFQIRQTKIDGVPVFISRTGYTGDLGYEVWADAKDCLKVWDALMAHGKPYGIMATALDAMDVTRIEAGFILNGVDYFSSLLCPIESRKSSPYELNLGWTVQLERDTFKGQKALKEEKKSGTARTFVAVETDWLEYEALFKRYKLPPEVPSHAWRTGVPIYNADGEFVGQATSGTWSPLLKKNLALATVLTEYATPGTELQFEVTAEYRRETVTARVIPLPPLQLERKRQ